MKKKVALVTGGYSGEAVISYKSAKTIFDNLDKEKYEVTIVDVTPEGWFAGEDKQVQIDRNDFTYEKEGKKTGFDVVFIGMHGTPGEDGKLQGYFDMLGIPYTSCNAASSALTFNKRYTVAVASMAGISVARSVHLFRDRQYDSRLILSQLQLPYFVKPNNGGSSIGMSKVTNAEQLDEALEKAFKEDDQVLVEEMILGREFTVGVYRARNEIHVLPITEVITHNEFFDFEAKYQGKSSEITPAEIEKEWVDSIVSDASLIYSVFNCSGVVRIDFIYNEEEGKPYMLEINTVPGQSEASIIPQQVKASGQSLKEFYSALVEEALSGTK